MLTPSNSFRLAGALCAAALLAGSTWTSALAQGVQYGPTSVIPAGTNPTAATSADIDGDGDLDLVVCNAGTDSIDLFENDGAGNFTQLANYAVNSGPLAVEAGDFDGNGHIDLAVMCNTASRASILLNAGNGVFAPAVTYLCGQDPVDMAVQDLDQDGDLDLTFVNFTIGTLTVLINNGSGGFSFFFTGLAISGPTSIAFGDLDGDGDNDAVVASGTFSAVNVIRNDITAYTPIGFFATGFFPTDIALEDVDFDQRPDIVTTNVGSNDISVLRNRFANSTISFASANHYAVGEAPLRVVMTNADNILGVDLAVTNWNGQHLRIMSNDGSGNFATAEVRYTGANPLGVVSADFDGDQDDDLLTTDFFTARLSLLENQHPTRLYAGTNEDLTLGTGVNGPPTSGPGNYVKTVAANDVVNLFMESPNGTFANMEALIVVQLYFAGFPPIPPIAGVHVNEFGFGAIVVRSTPMLAPLGEGLNFMMPPGFGGFYLMSQALVVDQQAANGLLAASDGYEMRLL